VGPGMARLPAKRFVVHFYLKTALLVISILHTPLTTALFFTGLKLHPPGIGIEAPGYWHVNVILSVCLSVGLWRTEDSCCMLCR